MKECQKDLSLLLVVLSVLVSVVLVQGRVRRGVRSCLESFTVIVLLLDECAQDDEDLSEDDEDLSEDDEDWYELLGMPESRLVSSRSFQTTERLAPSLAPHTRRVPFLLSKEE